MSPSDALLAARDLMRERGMARYALENGDGAVCLLGALNLAEGGDARSRTISDHTAYRALSDVCWVRFGTAIPMSNNHHIRDIDEACDVLEAAAKRAAEEV